MRYRLSAVASMSDNERLHSLLQVTAPREWAVLAAVAALISALVLWGVFGTLEDVVDAPCAVVPPGVRHAVVSPAAGAVRTVGAVPGDPVDQGAVLARIGLPAAERELRIEESRLESIELQAETAGSRAATPRLDALRERVDLLRAEVAAGGVIGSPIAGVLEVLRLGEGSPVADGQAVGWVRAPDPGPPAVLAFVPEDDSPAGGEPARVSSASGGRAVPAVVRGPVPAASAPPAWLVDLGLLGDSAAGPGRLVALDPADEVPPSGACRARIVVGTHAPILLLSPAGVN